MDKTGLIACINKTLGTADKLTCVTRPRRFGKSFAAKMLCAYYDKSCDSRELFQGLEISRDESFEKYLNKFNVIYLDITSFLSYKSQNGRMDVVERIENRLMEVLSSAFSYAKEAESLPDMLFEIARKEKEKFIFIIDEWDALFRVRKENRALQESYIEFLRGLFKDSELTDQTIAGAYMTGILPIKKYGTESALTDFCEYSMLNPKQLQRFVGFTEDEVRALCENSSLSFEEVQKWYDGYIVGNQLHIYSPLSVMEALDSDLVENYWNQTGTYESLKIYIEMNLDGLKEAVIEMLKGCPVPVKINTSQNDLTSMESRDDVLTLLVHLGYLTYDWENETVFIPNEEVRMVFKSTIDASKRSKIAEIMRDSDKLLNATLGMDEKTVAALVEKFHEEGPAPLFYNDEQALRSVIRMAYITCVDHFLRIEELPSGHGYADMVFMPKKASPHPLLLVELKWDESDEGAIKQIKDNNYPQAIKDYGGEILLVGINYSKKDKHHTCKIEKFYI